MTSDRAIHTFSDLSAVVTSLEFADCIGFHRVVTEYIDYSFSVFVSRRYSEFLNRTRSITSKAVLASTPCDASPRRRNYQHLEHVRFATIFFRCAQGAEFQFSCAVLRRFCSP